MSVPRSHLAYVLVGVDRNDSAADVRARLGDHEMRVELRRYAQALHERAVERVPRDDREVEALARVILAIDEAEGEHSR